MKNVIRYFLLVAGAAAIVFAARQRSLNNLRAGNEALRQQIQARSFEPAREVFDPPPVTNPAPALNPDEHTELLRLRGQIQPLRRELQELSNRVVALMKPATPMASTPNGGPPAPQPSPRKVPDKVMEAVHAFNRSKPQRDANTFNIALRDYLKSHSGELPDDLAKIETASGNSFPQGISARFELMRSGRIPDEAWAYTLVAREREPQKLPDGKLVRTYLRADGGTSTATLLSSASAADWEGWERDHEKFIKDHAQRK